MSMLLVRRSIVVPARSPRAPRRAGGTRTPNRPFWRPEHYQLSYDPSPVADRPARSQQPISGRAGAGAGSPPTRESTHRTGVGSKRGRRHGGLSPGGSMAG